jgi:NitT/TauT family transport system permease protein
MSRRSIIFLTQIAILAVFLAAWEFGVSARDVPFFGKPSLVAERLGQLFIAGEIWRHVQVTLTEVVLGYAMGAAVGLALGFALGRSRMLSDIFQPYILAFYSIPKIALAPVFIVWLGLGLGSKIAVVALSTFFLVFFNTYAGLQTLDQEIIRLARLMGADWRQTYQRVIVPASAPSILIGFRTAVPYAVIGAIIGEYIGAHEGLGHFILYAAQTFDAPGLFAGIAILVAFVFAANFGLMRLERRIVRWRPVEQALQT